MHRVGNAMFQIAIGMAAATILVLTPRSTAATGNTLTIGATSGSRGAQVTFSVTFQAPGSSIVAGTTNDISYDPINTPVLSDAAGKPLCAASQALINLNKPVSFAFLPNGCSGSACNALRAIVSDSNGVLIPSGTILFTCTSAISQTASVGIYTLAGSNAQGSSADGFPILIATINDQITITN